MNSCLPHMLGLLEAAGPHSARTQQLTQLYWWDLQAVCLNTWSTICCAVFSFFNLLLVQGKGRKRISHQPTSNEPYKSLLQLLYCFHWNVLGSIFCVAVTVTSIWVLLWHGLSTPLAFWALLVWIYLLFTKWKQLPQFWIFSPSLRHGFSSS